MATKSSLFTLCARFRAGLRSITALALTCLGWVLVLTACQTAGKGSPGAAANGPGKGQSQVGGRNRPLSASPSGGAVAAQEGEPRTTGPVIADLPPPPAKDEPKHVAVILGPGGAKAFAHLGVLKALQQQRIPVDKVIGLEWGSLVGGLFANKGFVHDVEWKLYKMENLGLPHPKGFFSRNGDDSVKVMDPFLETAFGKDDIGRAKIGFECPSRSLYTGVVTWQNRSLFKDAIKRCLPYPPVFKVQGSFMAGASQATEAIERLAKEHFNLIILVNVLGSALPVGQDGLLENANHVILWQEVKRALAQAEKIDVEVINVDTSSFPIMQFEAKKELVQLGEAAGQRAATGLISKYGF